MVPRKNKRRAGRRIKRDPQALERILKILRTGIPIRFAASAGQMSPETLYAWMDDAPEVAEAVEAARLVSVKPRWNLILKAAEDRLDPDGALVRAGDWKAAAWSLERGYPQEFSRPEIQLAVVNNNTVNNTANQLIVRAEVAEGLSARMRKADEAIEKLFAARRLANGGNGNGQTPKTVEVEARIEMDEKSALESTFSQTITMPAGDPAPGWWRQLTTGSGEREIDRAAAEWVVATISKEVLGAGCTLKVEFGESVTLSELLRVLEQSTGTLGWQRLVEKAGKRRLE